MANDEWVWSASVQGPSDTRVPSDIIQTTRAITIQVKEARVKEPRRPDGPIPSWEWYAEAAEETVPNYCVEPAKSGRSR